MLDSPKVFMSRSQKGEKTIRYSCLVISFTRFFNSVT